MGEGTEDLYRYDEEFRDTIATVDKRGKRIWLFPKRPGGILHQWRVVVTSLLLAIFFARYVTPKLSIPGKSCISAAFGKMVAGLDSNLYTT